MSGKKLIKVFNGRTDELRDEYQVKDTCYSMYVYRNDEAKNVEVVIKTLRNSFKDFWKDIDDSNSKLSPEEREKKDKEFKDDKPVDTTSWVHPDEESIRNELVSQLIACELFNPKSDSFKKHSISAGVLMSVLHSHSPKNPQSFTNFCWGDNYLAMLRELGNENKNYLMNQVKRMNEGVDVEVLRNEKREWKEAELKRIIKVE